MTAGIAGSIVAERGLVTPILEAVERAGQAVLEIYATEFDVTEKADTSPVTEADHRAEQLILRTLAEVAPDVPVIAEEEVHAGRVPEIDEGPFFLVDPLDGTREFVGKRGGFTVNVALVEGDRPRWGVVLAPARGEWYWVDADGRAMRKVNGGAAEPIAVRRRPASGLVAVASRSHRDTETDAFLATLDLADTISVGSSIKFCRVAEGAADVYPRFGPTMEWDTAAGQAVLEAAGGRVLNPDGTPFLYRKQGFLNGAFIAWGDGQG